jgi:hypothetical protein
MYEQLRNFIWEKYLALSSSASLDKINSKHLRQSPFPHLIIDNYASPQLYLTVVSEFKSILNRVKNTILAILVITLTLKRSSGKGHCLNYVAHTCFFLVNYRERLCPYSPRLVRPDILLQYSIIDRTGASLHEYTVAKISH